MGDQTSMPKNPLDNFDYHVECDDFLLYELGRLIEEDRASFEEEAFRRVIQAGIHEHIERRLDIRAEMARLLRTSGMPPDRMLRAIEDIESPLDDTLQVIQSYTAYLLQRLEACSESGQDDAITEAADQLLNSPGDREKAEASINHLASIRSAVSARVLAHVVSEPILDEDLEAKAYSALRTMWPLARPYILYELRSHTHEDIPFRWFQLMVDSDEPSSVDRVLEELLVHGSDDRYREDLLALTELLRQARDPETETKILQVLNSQGVARQVAGILEDWLKDADPQKAHRDDTTSPWASLDRIYAANRMYLTASRLFDTGKKAEAVRALDELLRADPQYPFAVMLRGLS
jgi:tetratricopeptide (TPR) repeat protein